MDEILGMSDIFKKTFIEGFQKEITIEMMIFSLLFTLLLSFSVFMMYRVSIKDVPFSKGFAVSMAMISVITAGIILAVQSSIVISLGMVGALSIVRFRTAIKNPMDLLFLFWSISLGIICGAGLYSLAIASSLIVALGITLYQIIPVRKTPQLLIVRMSGENAEDKVLQFLKEKSKKHTVKSRSLYEETIELTVELRVVKDPCMIARAINKVDGVSAVTMLAHDGEAIAQ